MVWIYNFLVGGYRLIIQIASLFHPKARKWVEGRKNWRNYLSNKMNDHHKDAFIVWVHCASLGEFEQGRPFIEIMKKQKPKCQIVLSFFSPSGYEVRKQYPLADLVTYLPADTKKNAIDWIEIMQPDLAVFVKYDFWYHYLHTLEQKKVSTILISAKFRSDQLFFKSYGGFYRKLLKKFNWIFLQDETSASLLNEIYIDNYSITGDTRIDRVAQLSEQVKPFSEVSQFVGESKVLVVGSSWPEDEKILLPFINKKLPKEWKVIIAPHVIKEEKIRQIVSGLKRKALRYSNIKSLTNQKVLIIDNIGMLNALYQYGEVAYIGGGFGKGIHNTLEPMAFGLPVIFGPRYQAFSEAVLMVAQGGAFSVGSTADLEKVFEKVLTNYGEASQKVGSFIKNNRGATQLIFQKMDQLGW